MVASIFEPKMELDMKNIDKICKILYSADKNSINSKYNILPPTNCRNFRKDV